MFLLDIWDLLRVESQLQLVNKKKNKKNQAIMELEWWSFLGNKLSGVIEVCPQIK
jgi:hypothetical protein